ncbi:transcriptional regulator [Ensifer sp. HO-A22]|uniref:Transcriptional regulator n=1 Tax=Ensifer oleiphilus TaxID=2742698 RepID=A0A7Y6UQP4_9HYPH|nr:transcriptional regulator [Ensifer oleiphilus]NVD42735.1 transcriptional regulator [Ensifer oleiphilus]
MNFNNWENVACVQDDTIGGRMSLARDALNVSAQSAAKIVGVETKTWFDWENDRAAPRANRLAMIAGVLSVSLSWLLTGRGAGPR